MRDVEDRAKEQQGQEGEPVVAHEAAHDEPARTSMRFSSHGAVPAVEQDAQARPSASQLAYSDDAKQTNEQSGHLRGSWLGDAWTIGKGAVLGGAVGGYQAYKEVQAEHAKEAKPEPTKPTEPPKMTSRTHLKAPNGAPPEREEVGVGEQVTFTGSAAGKWHAQGGGDAASTDTFVWTAPSAPGHYKITLEVDGQIAEKTMHVIEPHDIKYTKDFDLAYGKGNLGAGMMLDMDLLPNTVSFAAVGVKEEPGKAASVKGFFETVDSAHHPTWKPTAVDANNHLKAQDKAEVEGYEPDKKGHWTPGKVEWIVPHSYTVGGSKPQSFAYVKQSMEILNAEGDAQTKKAGEATDIRNPKKGA